MDICARCNKPHEATTKWCPECLKYKRGRNKAKKKARRAAGRCIECGTDALGKRFCLRCLSKRNRSPVRKRYINNRNKKLRVEAINAYGGPICKCCGEANIKFLTLDHTNNDGYIQRRAAKPAELLRRLKKAGWPPGLQVMCFNCNCGRAANGGVCPHVC